MFFTWVFGLLLAKYNFRNESVFTTIYHGRNDSRLNDTVGMLVKTLPVRCCFTPDAGEYLKAVQSQLMGAMEHDI